MQEAARTKVWRRRRRKKAWYSQRMKLTHRIGKRSSRIKIKGEAKDRKRRLPC